jgi:O-antigen/teichoic acid export membrane protein
LAAVSQLFASVCVIWLVKESHGIAVLGIWSLMISTFSVINVSAFGLGQTMVHFTQKTLNHPGLFRGYFRTTMTITLCSGLLFSTLLYLPVSALIAGLFEPNLPLEMINMPTTLAILLSSFCVYLLGQVPGYVLNSLGYFWIAQLSLALGNLLYLILTFLMVEEHGLPTVALGHLSMSLIYLLISWVATCILVRKLHCARGFWQPFGIDLSALKAMFGLGISFQATSLLVIFLEPLARYTIGFVGGVGLVGFYEMASRYVTGVRELIARPLSYLSGQFSYLVSQNDADKLNVFYTKQLTRLFWLGALMFGSLLTFSPLILDYWVGERNSFVITSIVALAFGWSWAVPALAPWYFGVGSGKNNKNLLSIVIMFSLFAASSVSAILFREPLLVPIGLAASITIGELYLVATVSRQLLRAQRT